MRPWSFIPTLNQRLQRGNSRPNRLKLIAGATFSFLVGCAVVLFDPNRTFAEFYLTATKLGWISVMYQIKRI